MSAESSARLIQSLDNRAARENIAALLNTIHSLLPPDAPERRLIPGALERLWGMKL